MAKRSSPEQRPQEDAVTSQRRLREEATEKRLRPFLDQAINRYHEYLDNLCPGDMPEDEENESSE